MPVEISAEGPAMAPGAAAVPAAGNTLFPVFLKLEQFRVLLVGGGNVGLEKLTAILRNSPATAVTVVAPRLHPDLVALAARHPAVQLHPRPYADADLDAHDFVFVATDDHTLNRQIRAAASARRLLTNVADTPDECDFYLSSIVQKGDLKIAISTNGKSPTVGKRLRALLEETLPDELHALLGNLTVVRQRLGGDFANKVRELNQLTAGLVAGRRPEAPATVYWRRVATGLLVAFAALLGFHILSYYFTWPQIWAGVSQSTTFYTFIAVGFVAQLIDGMLGMGYGIVSAMSLMTLGISPASVSASIHTAEMFASGASGYNHYRFGNVNKRLFRVLLLPGILGSVTGALLLARFGSTYATYLKPLLAVYLLLLGMRILSRAWRAQADKSRKKIRHAGWLAGAGGFLDSFGGGGWGPLVTSTLIANGRTPSYVIGTVSLVEFFVTLASALTFFFTLGFSHWQIVGGLIVGGLAAAPLAARLAGRLPVRWMFIGVGLLVIFWSGWAIYKALPALLAALG